MSDEVRELLVSGNVFSEAIARAGVPAADQVSASATPEREPRKIPNPMSQALIGLNLEPASHAQRSSLLGELWEVWERCQKFYNAGLEQEYGRLVEAHEGAKEAVNAQRAVFNKLKRQLQENAVELVNLQNAAKMAGSAAKEAAMERKSLDRFASAKQIKLSDLRVTIARHKSEEADRKAAQHHEDLHSFQIGLLAEADRKLVQLIEAELEIAARLEGRDPAISHTGITRESERKAQRFI